MTQPSTPDFNLPSLLGQTLACTCDVEHTIPTQAIVLQSKALDQVASVCSTHLPGQRVLLVADEITYTVAGQHVHHQLQQAGYRVDQHILRPLSNHSASDHGEHHAVMADEATIAAALTAIQPDTDFLIAVGAGTVNDVAKLASFQAGLPYVTCPTAPSVNGFTSAIAAIMSHGVKRTVPAHLPVAVIADVDVIATAPAVMRRAGLGDMLSKPVSNADWKLAHLIKGGYYCDTPLRMVETADSACRDHAVAIGEGAPVGIEALTQALLLSGFSMAVAGSSSPASGGEHLMSHYWDMTAHWHHREEQLHGAQVGVATLVTASLYEKLQHLNPSQLSLDTLRRTYPSWDELEPALRRVHGPLADEVIAEARKKYLPLDEKEQEWAFILNRWSDLWQELSPLLVPSAGLREILQAAGAPTTVRELGISADELRTAFLHAKDIRGRYTVLDFAHDLGMLEPLCEDILRDSRVLT